MDAQAAPQPQTLTTTLDAAEAPDDALTGVPPSRFRTGLDDLYDSIGAVLRRPDVPEPLRLGLQRTERRLGGVLSDASALLSGFFGGDRPTAPRELPVGLLR